MSHKILHVENLLINKLKGQDYEINISHRTHRLH